MKYIYFFIFIFYFSSSFSQFEVIIETEEIPFYYMYDPLRIIETNNGNLFISQKNYPNRVLRLYKIDDNGEVLLTNILDTSNFTSNNNVQSSPFHDDHILIMGQDKIYSNNPCFIELDENLEILEKNILPFPMANQDSINSLNFISFMFNKDGNLTFNTRVSYENYSTSGSMLYEIDILTKDTLKTTTLPLHTSNLSLSDIIQMNYKYYLLSDTGLDYYIIKLEENVSDINFTYLNSIVMEDMDGIIYPNGVKRRAKILTDSTFIVSFLMNRFFDGSYPHSDDFCLASIILDTNFNVLNVNHSFDDDNNDVRNCINRNLDFTDKNNIFQVGVTNIDSMLFANAKGANAIMINIMDGELNLKSQHFYGYDGVSCYEAADMIATQDGGCAVASVRYIYENPVLIYGSILLSTDLHLLKVNQYGTLTPINNEKEVEISSMKLAYCYPNPAKDFFYVRYGAHLKNVSIELFDISGKKVLYRNLNKSLSKIDIQNFNAGNYIYNILSANKIIEKGKIIVE